MLEGLYGMFEAAERSIFVFDSEGTLTLTWVRDEDRPDYDELVSMTHEAVAAAASS